MTKLSFSTLTSFLILSMVTVFQLKAQKPAVHIQELNWPVETVYSGNGFTEGVVVAPNGLVYFSEMDSSAIMQYNPLNGKTIVWQDKSHTSNGLFIHKKRLYACETLGRSVSSYHISQGPSSRKIVVDNYKSKKLGSPNDLTIVGNTLFFSEFYSGRLRQTGAEREIFINRIYMYSLKYKTLDTLRYNFEMPNGVAKSPDNSTVFIGDIRTNIITRVNLKNHKIVSIEEFADISYMGESGPDGMAVAENGNLFIALFREGKVLVLDKNGLPLGYLNTGAKTTNCFLTNNDRTLYVTADGKLKKIAVLE
jgi:sugar lactone lactonase YvrE